MSWLFPPLSELKRTNFYRKIEVCGLNCGKRGLPLEPCQPHCFQGSCPPYFRFCVFLYIQCLDLILLLYRTSPHGSNPNKDITLD
uniref:Uncharacterized protein n=1 Tax=Oryza brachyantha TaxID=4533 RepID=J3KWJ9_ORYBR